MLVFSRHAGPGDSVFIASVLLHDFDRYPRIIGKKELEFSPFFDVMGHRLPMRFIRPHPKQREIALEAVRDSASNLEERDAFVLPRAVLIELECDLVVVAVDEEHHGGT